MPLWTISVVIAFKDKRTKRYLMKGVEAPKHCTAIAVAKIKAWQDYPNAIFISTGGATKERNE